MNLTPTANGQLFVWTDIDPAHEADFNAWYDREHMEERVAIPGMLWARRYRAHDDTARRYLAIYRTESLGTFTSDAYRAAFTRQTDWSNRNFARMGNTQRRVMAVNAEAGFGGPLNAYELMKSMITAGASGVHWEDQLASEKKCGHLGGKVLIPTGQHIRTLNAARLAADVADVPSVIIARTDAEAATLITSDVDERDAEFITGERTAEGFYKVRNGVEPCIARAKAYAPHADLIWMETGTPDLELARKFAEAVKAEFPDQMLAYNCSPSFNWKKNLDDDTIAKFQRELGAMGYTFQFITLAGFHALNHSMFDLAKGYHERQMSAYVELQEREFADEARGYTATKHQREVGTGYFDAVSTAINPDSSTVALAGSTESGQFH